MYFEQATGLTVYLNRNFVISETASVHFANYWNINRVDTIDLSCHRAA
jgi:hypothetical protein